VEKGLLPNSVRKKKKKRDYLGRAARLGEGGCRLTLWGPGKKGPIYFPSSLAAIAIYGNWDMRF